MRILQCVRCIALFTRRALPAVAVIAISCRAAIASPDTLVVCPNEFRPALVDWDRYRRSQGHELSYVAPPETAGELKGIVRQASKKGGLKFLVLIGDVTARDRMSTTVPTNYLPAKVNVRWGSTASIASDIPYADLNDDGLPELAIGRIPADSPAQLAIILRKSLRYEQQTEQGDWQKRLNFASCQGGFGAVTDALIEAAARQIIQQNVPADYDTQHIFPGAVNGHGRTAANFAALARQQLSDGSLAWVYLGHGLPTELDHVRTATGSESILAVGDVPKLRCAGHSPLAVLVACYTGAMDARSDCLAEELLKADEGPVAVLAATRVTMPYGNTVLGCELLRACFRDRPDHLGETLQIAEKKTLVPAVDDHLRTSLDSLAAGISPSPVDLESERREHVLMYHLLGDPLLHLRYPAKSDVPETAAAATPLVK